MKIVQKVNFSLKETINAESATNVLKNLAGQQLKVNGLLIGVKEEADEETGELKTTKIGVLKTVSGELVSSISPTVIGSIETIISAYEEQGMLEEIKSGIDVLVKASKSAKNREFFHLELL
jgi:hypothetical protein